MSTRPASRGRTRAHPTWLHATVIAAVYAGFVSGARPFTVPADVAVSVPSAIFVAALVTERLAPGAGPWRRIERTRPTGGGAASPWVLVLALGVAVELAAYFHGGPRADYPTISYGMTELFRSRAADAAGWFAWLAVGWYLVRR